MFAGLGHPTQSDSGLENSVRVGVRGSGGGDCKRRDLRQ